MPKRNLTVLSPFLFTFLLLALNCLNSQEIKTEDFCGDGTVSPDEDCDSGNLGGKDCVSLGYVGGTLKCSSECVFDTSECGSTCGDGVADADEDCDGLELHGHTCQSLGFIGGWLTCTEDCLIDDSSCTGTCCYEGVCFEDMSEYDCDVGGFEPSMTCSERECEWNHGACCTATECHETFTDEECASVSGTFHWGLSCLSACPPTGACCSATASCAEAVLESQCTGSDTWHAQTTCTAACPETSGACCISGGQCTYVDNEAECLALSGFFNLGQSCADACLAVGSCCMGTSCSDFEDQDMCNESGGTWRDATCAELACEVAEACCLPDQSCVETTATLCADQGGTTATGTTCAETTCGPPPTTPLGYWGTWSSSVDPDSPNLEAELTADCALGGSVGRRYSFHSDGVVSHGSDSGGTWITELPTDASPRMRTGAWTADEAALTFTMTGCGPTIVDSSQPTIWTGSYDPIAGTMQALVTRENSDGSLQKWTLCAIRYGPAEEPGTCWTAACTLWPMGQRSYWPGQPAWVDEYMKTVPINCADTSSTWGCCQTGSSCAAMTVDACTTVGGSVIGFNETSCLAEPGICSVAVGPCYRADGSCENAVPHSQCMGPGEAIAGLADSFCGRCIHSTGCENLTEMECSWRINGVWTVAEVCP